MVVKSCRRPVILWPRRPTSIHSEENTTYFASLFTDCMAVNDHHKWQTAPGPRRTQAILAQQARQDTLLLLTLGNKRLCVAFLPFVLGRGANESHTKTR